MQTKKITKNALILVDIQNDFCPGGSLAVPAGDTIVSLANILQAHFDLVIATQDWHPEDHMSFATNQPGHQVGETINVNGLSQVLWPAHCIQNSTGALFHRALETSRIDKIIHKGADSAIDSYSAFFDNAHLRSTGLADYLQDHGVKSIYLMGLATDYCVKYSCLDAVGLGFDVHLILDACRGIDLQAGDIAAAINEMRTAGVKVINSNDIVDKNIQFE
jgi:nicotinamidase/pyrazinamidase